MCQDSIRQFWRKTVAIVRIVAMATFAVDHIGARRQDLFELVHEIGMDYYIVYL
jgi:hypothetical protein